MRIRSARVRNYRSVLDSTDFTVDATKTILVGVNESGKTALLRAMQYVNPPKDVPNLDVLADYPRRLLNDLTGGRLGADQVPLTDMAFTLEDGDKDALPDGVIVDNDPTISVCTFLDGHREVALHGFQPVPTVDDIYADLQRLQAHVAESEGSEQTVQLLGDLLETRRDAPIEGPTLKHLATALDACTIYVDEDNQRETGRHAKLVDCARTQEDLARAQETLIERLPLLVYYSSYFTVRPRINLEALADRECRGDLDTEYDFGNLCLLKFLGFTAQELSDLAASAPAKPQNYEIHQPVREEYDQQFADYQKRLEERAYKLNGASVRLTEDISRVWGNEGLKLRVVADGQYLRVVVEDSYGVEVELDQRSEGFRWLVSFFVVFRAQAHDELKNAILLLDEPGLSLHALKQQQFRQTINLLGHDNQIIYTTHSPFMVGSDELDLVRLVEMADLYQGTKVHTRIQVDDPKSLFPLQAALGYNLAQSMFSQKRNLVCEGVTDLFYLEAVNQAAEADGGPTFRNHPAIVPAGTASKVAYFCTFFTSQDLKVAALLDSDAAGTRAAEQDQLAALLPNKSILRVGDFIEPQMKGAETEDIFRHTIGAVVKDDLGFDSTASIAEHPTRPVMHILDSDHGKDVVRKWPLAKAFAKWLQVNGYNALHPEERAAWARLVAAVNRAL